MRSSQANPTYASETVGLQLVCIACGRSLREALA